MPAHCVAFALQASELDEALLAPPDPELEPDPELGAELSPELDPALDARLDTDRELDVKLDPDPWRLPLPELRAESGEAFVASWPPASPPP